MAHWSDSWSGHHMGEGRTDLQVPASHRGTPGVLVVDDDPTIRLLLHRGLEIQGFQVWLAGSGPEAIELYQEHHSVIAVSLLDVMMPGMDGPQTLDALRQVRSDIVAGFMSGSLGAYRAEELLKRGATFFFDKPFRLDEVARILSRMTRCPG